MAEGHRDPLQSPQSPRLQRVEHPLRLLAVALALAVAAGGSFVAGRFIEAPSREAILAAQEPITVLAEVERRVVDARVNFAGTVRDGEALDLIVASQVSPAVVVRRTLAAGDSLPFASMIGVVSGQPFFVLKGPLPMYRDLAWGDRGDDVEAFQKALGAAGLYAEATGVADNATFSAVRSLFKRNGFELEWGRPIPYRQFAAVANESGIVLSAAAVGANIGSSTPLVSVQVQPQHIYFRADAVASAELAVNDTITVRANGGGNFSGTIDSIGSFDQGDEGHGPGRDVVITSSDPEFRKLTSGSPVTVLGSGQNDVTMAVPISSIRQDSTGDYVDREEAVDGRQHFKRVAVTVLNSGGGWVALDDVAGLRVGDKVRVS